MASKRFCPVACLSRFVSLSGAKAGTKLVLAYSGGVDSEVLAYGLGQFAKTHPQYQYLLVHVHHGLSDNADIWQRHCEGAAQRYGLPVVVKQVKVDCGPRVSVEAAAREARYLALQQQLSAGDLLLTAHHQDDQLETVLLALKRGLGPKGLAAMGMQQAFTPENMLLRPLLDVKRQQIEDFARSHQLCHIEDESNRDNRFDRNFLRLEVIPLLTQRWSAMAETASRSAKLCAEQQALLDEEVDIRLPAMLHDVPHSDRQVLDLARLRLERPLWRPHLLRGYIERSGFALPSAAQLGDILNQLLDAKADAKVEIRINSMLLRRFRDHLYVETVVAVQPRVAFTLERINPGKVQCWSIDDKTHLTLNWQTQGVRLRLDPAHGVSVRYGAPGSCRCHPYGRDKGRELKKLWQEFAVPPWERDRVPLIYIEDELVAAVGYWVDKRYLATGTEQGAQFSLD